MQLTDITDAHRSMTTDSGVVYKFGCSASGVAHLTVEDTYLATIGGIDVDLIVVPTYDIHHKSGAATKKAVVRAWHARVEALGCKCTLDEARCRLQELCDAGRAAYAAKAAAGAKAPAKAGGLS